MTDWGSAAREKRKGKKIGKRTFLYGNWCKEGRGGSWKLLLLYATAAATRIYTVWNGGGVGVGGVGSIVPQSEKRRGGEEAVALAIFPLPPTVHAADDLNSPPPPPHIRSPWCSTVQLLPPSSIAATMAAGETL